MFERIKEILFTNHKYRKIKFYFDEKTHEIKPVKPAQPPTRFSSTVSYAEDIKNNIPKDND